MPAALTVWPNKTFKFLRMLIIGLCPAGFLVLARLSARDRLTSSRPDAILVNPLPLKPKLPTTPHLHQVSQPRQPSRDVALKVVVWSRGQLVTLQILTSSSFSLVEDIHGSLGQYVSFSLIDVRSGFTAYILFLIFD